MYGLMQSGAHFGKKIYLSGANLRMSDLMTRLSHLLGSRPPLFAGNRLMAEVCLEVILQLPGPHGKPPAITRETARTALQHYFYSSALIEKELNFRFTDIEETFVYICDRIKKYHS